MLERFLLRIGDFVFVTRPLILVPVWCFYLLGEHTGAMAGERVAPRLPGLACLTLIMITAYLINQIFDQETDRLNDKGHYLTKGILGIRTVTLMAMLSFVGASYVFRMVAPAQSWPLVAALILSLLYSLPPLRLCARPFADAVANAIGYGGLAFVIGYGAFGAPGWPVWLVASPYVAFVASTFLHTTILDVEGDRASGKNTTSVAIGVRPSAIVALVVSALGLIGALRFSWRSYGDWIAPAVLGGAVLIFAAGALQLMRAGDNELATRSRVSSTVVQLATALTAAAASVAEPLFLTVLIPLVLLARLYYQRRFGIRYPGPVSADVSQVG